jgi:hypothetical protein
LVLIYFIASVIMEFASEITSSLNADKEARPLAIPWLAVVGIGIGAVTGIFLPDRVLDPGPFEGVSLLAVPLLLGVLMQLWGWMRDHGERKVSHVATWYGGAVLGFGMALGRFVMLAFVTDVRSV